MASHTNDSGSDRFLQNPSLALPLLKLFEANAVASDEGTQCRISQGDKKNRRSGASASSIEGAVLDFGGTLAYIDKEDVQVCKNTFCRFCENSVAKRVLSTLHRFLRTL
jgi:hypothetical protein